MSSSPDEVRGSLLDKRNRLATTIDEVSDQSYLWELLAHVDTALNRLSVGTYGTCETCHKTIEPNRLRTDPLIRYCSSHLTSEEQIKIAELDKDFSRASCIQAALLPKCGLCLNGWQTYYNYTPAGKVGGDFCDLVASASTDDLFFFFGDAVGKGIAGSMIIVGLHCVFRTLLSLELPLKEMFERANRLFCESLGPDYYATVVCGRASSDGNLELVNAGHLPLFILRSGQAIPLPATGVPLGLFYTSMYGVTKVQLVPGETLVCYTDGITEARNGSDGEYGPERFGSFVAAHCQLSPEELVQACVEEVKAFTSNASPGDDRTLMALRRVEGIRAQVDGREAQLKRAAVGQT